MAVVLTQVTNKNKYT